MALKLNVNRTFKHPIPVKFFDESGKVVSGSFNGVFNVLKASNFEDKETKLIDLILVAVDGIELVDEHGNQLVGDDLLQAVKDDSDLASACIEAYNEASEKKRTKPKT